MLLRGFQDTLMDDARDALRAGHRRICVQMGTGGGKTVVASAIIQSASARGNETWMMAHKNFLVEQASEKLKRFGVHHGIVSSSGRYNPRQHVHVCSLGVLRNRHKGMAPPKIIILDECHHIGARTWAEMMDAYPDAIWIGLTATPIRPGGGGLGDHFDHLITGPGVAELIQWGKDHPGEGLCDYRYFTVKTAVHTDGLHTRAGEFIAEEAAELVDKPAIIGDAVEEFQKHCPDRRFLSFAVNVKHAAHVAEQYQAAGINCVMLDGSMTKPYIKSVLRDLEAGRVQGVASVNLLLEGLDVSSINCVQWLRPTKSRVVKMQGDGRGLRNEIGKDHLVILDHVENWKHFGWPDDEVEWSLEPARRSVAPVVADKRECKRCYCRYPLRMLRCPECGQQVEVRERVIEEGAGELVEVDRSIIVPAKRTISPERRAQGMAKTPEAMFELFLSQKAEKLGRALTDEERQSQWRRVQHVMNGRQQAQRRRYG